MRKYTILKKPIPMNDYGDMIKKVMVYQKKYGGVYVFLSTTIEDGACSPDVFCDDLEFAEEYCLELGIESEEWVMIDDPLTACQHDFISPVRIKCKDIGKLPEYEVFNGVSWVGFKLKK